MDTPHLKRDGTSSPGSKDYENFEPTYRTLPEQIAANLRQQILTGHIHPGTPLIETELAARTKTSRGPIRDAISLLARDGLVVKVPNRRACVIDIGERTLREAASLRALQESFAGDLALKGMSLQAVERLGRIARRMYEAGLKNDRSTFNALDIEFHDCLVRGSGHQALYESWRSMHHRVRLFISSTNMVGNDLVAVARHHVKIFDALRHRDRSAIRRALRAHYKQLDQDLSEFLKGIPQGPGGFSRLRPSSVNRRARKMGISADSKKLALPETD